MAMTKRQRRENPMKIEQRKVGGPEWEPQVKQTALLASSIYIRQAQREEKKHKKEEPKLSPWLLFSSLLLGRPALTPQGCIFFPCQIKLSCNTGLSLASNFCCSKTEPRKLHTPLTSLVPWLRFNLAEITTALPLLSGGGVEWKLSLMKNYVVEAEHEGNPAQWKWPEAQHARNLDGKNQLGRKLTRLSLRFRKTSG